MTGPLSELVQRAQSLAPQILAAREAMDRDRHLPDVLARHFADAGFHRLCIPKTYGGLEVRVQDFAGLLETLARIEASAAWCVMIGATTGSLAAYMDEDAAQAVFAKPETILAGVYAPTGTAAIEGDHYRVSGRWKWNSGGRNADWIGLGCMLQENGAPLLNADGGPVHRMLFLPKPDVQFLDTWQTSGLKGTGSGDVVVKEARVPRARSASLTSDPPRSTAPLFKFPAFGLLALGIAAVACGNAMAALDEFADLARAKKLGGRTLAERSTVQAAFASAHAELCAARALMLSEMETGWDEAQAGSVSLAMRARLRLSQTHMVRTAADCVRRLQDLAGGAGVFLSDPLHRRACDAQTMTAHLMTALPVLELTGRALLGQPVNAAEL